MWWYLDAFSDDGQHGITLIAFIGSVFSPYYAWARRRNTNVDPENFCAINIALYGRHKRWAMTERGRAQLSRSASEFNVGPSTLQWNGNALKVQIDECTVPLPGKIQGMLTLYPTILSNRSFSLDKASQHHWQPIAPCARIDVKLDKPALKWSGFAYLDTNFGVEPLEQAFTDWNWSRSSEEYETTVLYDINRRDGEKLRLALRYASSGQLEQFQPPPIALLPRTRWRVARATQSEQGASARIIETLEDTPFYARSIVETQLLGKTRTMVHESLSLDRFRLPIVQLMLPFRMPRKIVSRTSNSSQ